MRTAITERADDTFAIKYSLLERERTVTPALHTYLPHFFLTAIYTSYVRALLKVNTYTSVTYPLLSVTSTYTSYVTYSLFLLPNIAGQRSAHCQ